MNAAPDLARIAVDRPVAYFDHNAGAPLAPEALAAMLPYLAQPCGNPSSPHASGRRALAALAAAREAVAALLGCAAGEIVFTGGGTEANNLALLGALQPGDHAVTSAIEHASVAQALREAVRLGCTVTVVGVDRHGQVDPAAVQAALRLRTRLVSVMTANNETGVLQPVAHIARIAQAAGALFHTDAVQAAGKVALRVEDLGCDLLSVGAHKIHGPQGVGALYVRRGVALRPRSFGGRQERGRRAGTENVAGVVGFGRACALAQAALADGSLAQMAAWRDRIEQAVLARLPDTGVNGAGAPRVPNTSNLYADGVGADALVRALDADGIAVSRGAACAADDAGPSNVLMAMGLSGERSRSSIRVSLGRGTTAAEVERLIDALIAAVTRLRATQPVDFDVPQAAPAAASR